MAVQNGRMEHKHITLYYCHLKWTYNCLDHICGFVQQNIMYILNIMYFHQYLVESVIAHMTT